jgi:hypothetical protein
VRFKLGSLKTYLGATVETAREHEAMPADLMSLIDDMDEIFHREFFSEEFDVDPLAGILMMNTYTLLLSAIREALSGYFVTVFPAARAALDSACDAF